MSQRFTVASEREWQRAPRPGMNHQFIRTELHGDIYQALAYLKQHPKAFVKIKLAEGTNVRSKAHVVHEYASRQELPRIYTLFNPETGFLLITARSRKELPLPLPAGASSKRLFLTTTASEWRDIRTSVARKIVAARTQSNGRSA
jgi:hypothetical protein